MPPVSFEEFMRRALYDPAGGYYSRRITGIGGRGDFTTAPLLADTLALAIAGWAAAALRQHQCRDLVEIGPGSGTLARQVWCSLPWHLRIRTRLHLVESSPPLIAIQRQTLGKSATWHASPAPVMAACKGRAVVFSNELVDAFPVRRFVNTADGWREILVARDLSGNFREFPADGGPLPDSSSFHIPHPTDQKIEVHESYHRWLAEWMPMWRAGAMITIDYGDVAATLYHRRPQGTLRAYLLHQRLEGPEIYQNVGRQDLTADVNFTDLTDWSRPWCGRQNLCDLGEFIARHLPPGKSCKAPHPMWLDPDGAASAFKVLEQVRNP
jgi:SAM-dependent MidA family methyltransferase